DGHPHLALSLNNVGVELERAGRLDQARAYQEEALDIRRRLYPKARFPAGHPDLAVILNNLGVTLERLGRAGEALRCYEEALDIHGRLVADQALTAPEADALDLVTSLPRPRDTYLSATRRVAGTDAAAYRAVWDTKAQLTRVLERRHLATRLAL